MTINYLKAAMLCALALAALAAAAPSAADEFLIESDSEGVIDNFHYSRSKRTSSGLVPSWQCTGSFSSDGNRYNVHCTTNLEVLSVDCTLDGEDYACNGLVFSVDISDYVGGVSHDLHITASARYGSGTASLRYMFRFSKQVSSQSVTCRSRQDGQNLIITCTGAVITSIQYSINNGAYQNANSVSSFTVQGSQLVVGTNTIRLRITVGGVTRTLTLTAQKTAVVFQPSCSVTSDNSGNVICRCSGSSGSEAIQSIKYTINGGTERTASSLAEFQISSSDLQVGQNTITITITSVSGVVRTIVQRFTRTLVVTFSPSYRASTDSASNVMITTSVSSGSEAIQSITYTINGGAQQTASSVSNFTISGSDLRVGLNTIAMTFTSVSGTVRTFSFRVTKIDFSPSYSTSYQSNGNVRITCSVGTGSEAIQSIRYSINGGVERTASSVTGFAIDASDLRVGQNVLAITFISVSGASRTVITTVTKTQSQVRVFRVQCRAGYSGNDVIVNCSTQGESEAISYVYYRVNGGGFRVAPSVSSFVVSRNLLTREVNTIAITLLSSGGLTRTITLNLATPLSLSCRSSTNATGVAVTCTSNRQSSTLTVKCYLNGVLQTTSGLVTNLNFNQLSQGRHTYTVVVTDSNGLIVRNQLSFENKLTVTCRGSLNLGANIYAVQCFCDRSLSYTCTIDGQQVACPASLEIDISTLSAGFHTLVLTGTDTYGNTATSTSTFNIPQAVGSCTIDTSEHDDVVDWRCTDNVAGVSIVCLVDGIRLEDCLCQLESEFYIERYSEGDHTVSLILTGRDGSSKRFDKVFTVETLRTSSSQAIEDLEFECRSKVTNSSVIIDCSSNKNVHLTCYLDDEEYDDCYMTNNVVLFSGISQGTHTFAVVARDDDGLVDRSEVHFEEDLDISCRGSYNPEYDVVHLDCDSTRPLAHTECQLNNGTTIDCPTPYNVPVEDFVNGFLSLRVSAQDAVGNSDTEELTFSSSSCEGC